LAETERLANMCNKQQTNVLDRVGLQQSSSKDFPFATGLPFWHGKIIWPRTMGGSSFRLISAQVGHFA
jgi:hypothetical protein